MSSVTPLSAAWPATANGRAIVFMVAAMACFICNDTLVKSLGTALPVAQILVLRSLLVMVVLLAATRPWIAHGDTPAVRWSMLGSRWVVLRALCDAAGTFMYLTALVNLPIANASAIGMSLPLMLVVLAALFLGERVGLVRSLVAGLGFLGVLLVIQPRIDGFNAFALLCLTGVVFHAMRDLITRQLPRQIPSVLISLSSALGIALVGGLFSLQQGWLAPNGGQVAMLVASSLLMAAAYQLIITSLRTGELSVIAPFRYSTLLFALIIGWLLWDDVPNPLAWLGIALITGSGLLMLRLQSVPAPRS